MKRTLLILAAALLAGPLSAQSIDLPTPQKSGGMPLMEALSKRATVREFSAKELSPQQLSSLLWAAFGINRPDGKRTAPSANNRQEADIYVLLKSGVYVYSAVSNRLDRVPEAADRKPDITDDYVKDSPVNLFYVADLDRMGGSGDGAKRTANIDVGYISQNVYLFCASEGLASGAWGSMDRKAVEQRLKLRPNQYLVLAQSVGYASH